MNTNHHAVRQYRLQESLVRDCIESLIYNFSSPLVNITKDVLRRYALKPGKTCYKVHIPTSQYLLPHSKVWFIKVRRALIFYNNNIGKWHFCALLLLLSSNSSSQPATINVTTPIRRPPLVRLCTPFNCPLLGVQVGSCLLIFTQVFLIFYF